METVRIRKGSKLYRTPKIETQKEIFGTYYSRTDLACYYANAKSSNVYTFKTKRGLKLVDFTKQQSFEYFYTTLKGDDLEFFTVVTGYGLTELKLESNKEVLCYYKNKPKFQPKFCIIGYLNQTDEKEYIYLNKKFGLMMCKLGYDGIIMPGGYEYMMPQTKTVYKTLFGHTESPSYEYNEDIFICNPTETLEVVKIEDYKSSKLCKDALKNLE